MSKQFAIKEVVNCWLSKYSDDTPIFYCDYASDSTFSFEAERLDLRGGQGNYILVSFDHTKSGMMTLEMPLVDLEFLSQLVGSDLSTGAATVPYREVLTVASSAVTMTSSTPTMTGVWIQNDSRDYGTEQTLGSASTENQYEITDNVITLNSTSCPDGTKIICEYTYTAPADTRTITFTANNFPDYMKVKGIGTWLDEVDGENKTVVFEVEKAKPRNNFSLTQKSTEATILTMEFDLYTVTDGNDKKYMNIYQLA